MLQKSERLKIIKLVLGGIIIAFSGYRFSTITNPSPFFATYPGIAVLVIGIINILKGILNKKESKITKSIETGIGIIAIVVGIFVFVVYQTDVSSRSIWLLFLFIVIQGIGIIGTAITQRTMAKAIRILKISIGISFIILTGLLLKYPESSVIVISGLLSVNMLLIGLEVIRDAIGHKIVGNNTNTN